MIENMRMQRVPKSEMMKPNSGGAEFYISIFFFCFTNFRFN